MATRKKKPTGKLVVTQSNSLIDADYSKTDLAANPLKLFKLALSKISPADKDLRLIRINMPMYKQYMGYKLNTPYGRLNQDLESYCLALNSQMISIAMDDGTILNAFAISSWRIDHNNDELIIEISGQLKPLLLKLRGNYTSYQLWNIPRLKSSYTIRLYELLCSQRRFGKRTFELEDLKAKIGCSYGEYGIFKRRVILKAQKDLKALTDLRFEFEENKTGRKVTEVVFYTYPNNPEEHDRQQAFPFLDEENLEEQTFTKDVLELFKKLGISEANLSKMYAKGWDVIEDISTREKAQKRCRTLYEYYGEKLTLLQQSKQQISPAGFFIKSIKEDWLNPSLFRKKQVTDKREKLTKNRHELKQLEKHRELKYKELSSEIFKISLAHFREHPDELEEVIERVLPVGSPIRGTLVKVGLTPFENYETSLGLSALVNNELKNKQPDIFSHLSSMMKEVKRLEADIETLKLKV